ncbi:MAG: secY [Gammaproteobacteria bacterium]|jgi:preprotein translocase subunit SecY|nr:secY [Gammaproteobacteria bacterium]
MATTAAAINPRSGGGLKELKQRIFVVILAVIVFRIGAHITIPGLDPQRLTDLFSQQQNGIIGLFNLFSGGALSRLSVFALGVMPYITASIMVQLLSAVVPALEQLKKEGEAGKRKINQYTRYGTLVLAIFQAFGMSKLLASSGAALAPGLAYYFTSTITLATGCLFLMWLGEQVTERGVGNGISIIIFAGIVSGFPGAVGNVLEQVREGQMSVLILLVVVLLVLVVTGFVVFMERAQRRITVNYARRQQGRRMYAAQSSHLPLKVNMAGVIPPIFASSIILFPATLASFFGQGTNSTWLNQLSAVLGYGQPLYMLILSMGIVFFCFFYTALVFNPRDTADNLKKSGAFIPGYRPGEQTAQYIDDVMTRLTLVGAVYLVAVSLLPEFMSQLWHVPFYFGGTSLLIVVVVVMDFMAQVQAHLMSHQYESLMRKQGGKGQKSMGGLLR